MASMVVWLFNWISKRVCKALFLYVKLGYSVIRDVVLPRRNSLSSSTFRRADFVWREYAGIAAGRSGNVKMKLNFSFKLKTGLAVILEFENGHVSARKMKKGQMAHY